MRMIWNAVTICLAVASASGLAAASEALAPTRTLDTVVVSGKQPGPGFWRVSKDGRELWLLGTVSPLPKRMQWSTDEVEAAIAQSQAVLLPPRAEIRANAALGGLFLLPSLLKARNNPDKQTLEQLLPAADYARWLRLKQRYLGRDRGVEKRRPILAAGKLYEEALDESDLSGKNLAAKVAERAAKRHDVTLVTPSVELVIEDPKSAIKDFSGSSLDDVECFRRSLDRVESDLDRMKLRANAWALGEIGILRSLPLTDTAESCLAALMQNRVAQRLGLDDLRAKVENTWLDAAETALRSHQRSFGLLPMDQLLRDDGLLARLVARGYTVQAPAETRTD
jgi:uncharacterized protein YbaP (TraB family)